MQINYIRDHCININIMQSLNPELWKLKKILNIQKILVRETLCYLNKFYITNIIFNKQTLQNATRTKYFQYL